MGVNRSGRAGMVAGLVLALLGGPAQAQFTVLDQAQDSVGQAAPAPDRPAEPAPPCGTQTISIASMGWPSAQLLAEIHARVLTRAFGCMVQVAPGDLAATGSSMGSTGQPAVAPEMWPTRVADVWNAAIAAQMLRPAAPTYVETTLESWFIPSALAAAQPELRSVAQLPAMLPLLDGGRKVRFISCPADWACAVINRNLVTALGLTDLVDLVEPANRFEMDSLIAEAVSRNEAVLFYYWQPNALLAQLSPVALDMGAYNAEAAKCLAQAVCAAPQVSAFAPEAVLVALDALYLIGFGPRLPQAVAELHQASVKASA